MKVITRTSLVTSVDGVTIKSHLAIGEITTSNSIFIGDKMNSDKMNINCNEYRGIDSGCTSITRADGIEHGCVGVEQQAILGRQSASAKVVNEVKEKSSVSEVPMKKRTYTGR